MQTQEQPAPAGAHLVIVGGGVAGLEIASTLGKQRHASIDRITLIDADSAHVWKPMLHTIAAGTRDLGQQQTTYVAQASAAHFYYQPGRMGGLDRARRHVQLQAIHAPDGREVVPARTLGYDKLVLAVGSGANDFGTPGVLEHCFMIDSRRKAESFNEEIRLQLLRSMMEDAPVRIAIVGAGATGVELAAELVQLAHSAAAYGVLAHTARYHIALIESGPRVLPSFAPEISAAAQRRLQALGVQVHVGQAVRAATAQGLELEGGTLLAATLRVWAAGVKAPAFLSELGLPTTRNHQLLVNQDLQTPDPHIYAVGDCASFTLPGQTQALPPTAQVAHQQARYLCRLLPHAVASAHPYLGPGFAYRDMGALVSLAHYDAYGSLGKFGLFNGGVIQGRLAMLSHLGLYRAHQARLHGFWRGSLLWLVDLLNARLRPSIRLD